jgi:3,4-dihydroxy 2-butanone 4-phosphate synthase / GTP cyclohydrolase II
MIAGARKARTAPVLATVPEAIAAIGRGDMAIVVDDEDRENEGDFVAAADLITPRTVNVMATRGRGLICCPVPLPQLERLGIPPMGTSNRDRLGTAFHVGVDHRDSTTGISATERARTIRALADPELPPAELCAPGHVFPLAYRPGGVLSRPGHTEASVDLAVLAGRAPAAAICEIASADGEMARLPELLTLGRELGIPVVSISQLIAYRRRHEHLVERIAESALPLDHGPFRAIAFRDRVDGTEHLALTHGVLDDVAAPLVRLHSECLTGDVFGSCRCDCGRQLDLALRRIAEAGAGVVLYLRGHEGRGIGLAEKIRAYALQDTERLDTIQANLRLGFPADARRYGVATSMLRDLGVTEVRLLTNNPAKVEALRVDGIHVAGRVPLIAEPRTESTHYLTTKARGFGHLLADAV